MIRVLDLSCDLAGKYAARLLADHADDVISIALPESSPILAKAKARGVKSADLELLRDHLGRNKRHMTLDYGNPSGNKNFERLIGESDVVIHTFTPEISELLGLGAAALRAVNPSLLVVSITAHGHLSADAEKPATDKTLYAEGGALLVSGTAETRHPLSPNLPIASSIGGLYGAMAVLTQNLARRRRKNRSFAHIDIALRDLLPISLERVLSFYTYMKVIPFRGARRERIDQAAAMGEFSAKDGDFHIFAQHDPYAKIARLIDRPDLEQDEEWLNPHKRKASPEQVRAVVADAVRKMTIDELEAKGRELGIPAGPVREIDQLEALPQLKHRKALKRIESGLEIEEPYRFANFERPRNAPGAANAADLSWHARPQETAAVFDSATAADKADLAGLRVLDLTHAYAGPSATRILSDLGAEVIKVESVTHMDGIPRGLLPFNNNPTETWWERAGYFADRNLGKKSITLDMGSDEGREIFVRLIQNVDVVATNFRPRVMAKWGLGPARLLELNPKLVVLSMSGFGGTGPDSEKPALAGLIEASSGFTSIIRYADNESPTDVGFSFGDMISGLNAALSVLMALDRRDLTSRGDAIDLSCCEAPLPLLAAQLQAYANDGRRPSVKDDIIKGGRHILVHAQQDVDPESWVQAFVTPSQEDHITAILGPTDAEVVEYAGTRRQLERRLNAAGIIAAVLTNAEELVFSEQLNGRRVFQPVNRPSVGTLPYSTAFPALINGRPIARRDLGPPPRLGAHSAEVFGALLGMTKSEYEGLVERQVSGEVPIGKPQNFLRWPIKLDDLVRRGRVRPVQDAAERMARAFEYQLMADAPKATGP
jgi:crotonobetainyl-CoA:carnitine CoA-transferase CaiB-like acyl-CoA transferase